jgi:glycine/D-amino acid oxidase-like deaminating enzyme
MNLRNYDVIIAGAGIVGAACAYECAIEGLKVTVIDAGQVAGGATAAGMGHIVVMDNSEAQFQLTRYSRELWNDRSEELPDACQYLRAGTLWIAADENELQEVRRKQEYYSSHGVRTNILDGGELRRLEPNLRPDLAGALLVPDDVVLDPPSAASYFLSRAIERGTQLMTGQMIEKIDDSGVKLANGDVLQAGAYINASGWRAPQLTGCLPVVARKGHLVLTRSEPGFIRHQLVELGYLQSAHQSTGLSVAFNVQPRRGGEVIVGASRQFGAEDTNVEKDIVNRMLDRATAYVPSLANLEIAGARAGIRAATPDKLPLIGQISGYDRVFAATGHEGLGITTSLATARLLVDGMLGRESAISRQPYLPVKERLITGVFQVNNEHQTRHEMGRSDAGDYHAL